LANVLIQSGLSADFVKDAAQLLIMRFIPLNPSDLENWMSDPEEWFSTEDKEQEQWEYEIRVCCFSAMIFFESNQVRVALKDCWYNSATNTQTPLFPC